MHKLLYYEIITLKYCNQLLIYVLVIDVVLTALEFADFFSVCSRACHRKLIWSSKSAEHVPVANDAFSGAISH